jgi:serine/threonine protein kinase
MDHEDALPIGTLLADEYRIDGILGAGGFGITYRAHDVKLDIDVAIKEYFPRDFASRSNTVTVRPRTRSEQEQFQWGLSQFIDEARRLARLQHPNIVRCMRYFEENDTGYFVMTFEEGRTLETYFAKPPTQRDLDELLSPLLAALEALHATGIYHRDISPDNILVRDDGSPVLIDFGASRQAMARRPQTVAAIVKPGYSPIEQYDRETRQQGAWSDIYSLGATIYSIIAGGPPPDALSRVRNDSYVSTKQAARGAYRTEFLSAVDWALEPDPDSRPVTIREWRRKLLPNPSGRAETVATKFEPMRGGIQTLATRFFGKEEKAASATPSPKPVSQLRWPDYVLRGAALVMAAVFLIRYFAGDEQSPNTVPETVVESNADERKLSALTQNPDGVWNRVELVLRRLGHLRGSGTASISDIRSALKDYQSAIGQPKTGSLNQETLNRIMDEAIELEPYTVAGAGVNGRWFFEKDDKGCRISTGATRIEGRSILTSRPIMEIGRKRSDPGDTTGDTIDISLAKAEQFDAGSPVSLTAGTDHQMLKFQDSDVVMGDNADGYPVRDVTRRLRFHQGEVVLSGTSAYGGPLKLTFPTDGFEAAYRAMAAECGEGILYWIDDWGGVARDSNGVLWKVMAYGTEPDAKQQAMALCVSKSESGGCEHYAVFKEQCFALYAGEKRKDDWASGWATNSDLEQAKTLATEDCANQGGNNCELITHFCSDGSDDYNAPND